MSAPLDARAGDPDGSVTYLPVSIFTAPYYVGLAESGEGRLDSWVREAGSGEVFALWRWGSHGYRLPWAMFKRTPPGWPPQPFEGPAPAAAGSVTPDDPTMSAWERVGEALSGTPEAIGRALGRGAGMVAGVAGRAAGEAIGAASSSIVASPAAVVVVVGLVAVAAYAAARRLA